jgi:hypothetical protein
MVSYGDPELEVQEESIDSEGNISVEVRMALPCAECGAELKETTFTLEGQVEHVCDEDKIVEKLKNVPESTWVEGDELFAMDDVEPEATEDYKPKEDKKGKPVAMRYQKHFYGVSVTPQVTCNKCGEIIATPTLADECQASSFEELV